MILSKIGEINHHKFQHIQINEFEEGNDYKTLVVTNDFVKCSPPKHNIVSLSNNALGYNNI